MIRANVFVANSGRGSLSDVAPVQGSFARLTNAGLVSAPVNRPIVATGVKTLLLSLKARVVLLRVDVELVGPWAIIGIKRPQSNKLEPLNAIIVAI